MSERREMADHALQMKVESMAARPHVIGAIKDTWRFMTGEEMPEDVVEAARRNGTEELPFPLWGLKLAVQAANIGQVNEDRRVFVESQGLGQKLSLLQAQVSGELDFPPPDPEITTLISSLGERIIDTAYLCLGPDIEDKMAKTKAKLEKTYNPRKAISILVKAFAPYIVKFAEMDDEKKELESALKDENGRQLNHILKLSPRNISTEEGVGFKPSCAALSMIAASFFRQCGVDSIIHAGIMNAKGTHAASLAHHTINMVRNVTDGHGAFIPDNFREYLKRQAETSYKQVYDYDPHSALLVEVKGDWFLYDPYAALQLAFRDESAANMSLWREQLTTHPGLEFIAYPDSAISYAYNFEVNMMLLDWILRDMPSIGRWRKALDTAIVFNDPDTLLQVFEVEEDETGERQKMDLSRVLRNTSLLTHKFMTRTEEDTPDEEYAAIIASISDGFVKDSLAKQVFGLKRYSESKLKKCLERCVYDDRYRNDRVEDLYIWPMRAFLSALQDYRILLDEWPGEEMPYQPSHHSLEVGNLEHRVGSVALLDVSYGLGYELPLSFWTAQTSSQLPWLYHSLTGMRQDGSAVDRRLSDTLLDIICIDYSLYRQIAYIVDHGLEKGTINGTAESESGEA